MRARSSKYAFIISVILLFSPVILSRDVGSHLGGEKKNWSSTLILA